MSAKAQEALVLATPAEIAAFKANLFSVPDFKIRVGQYEWLVHSNVLSTQSKFFEKICGGQFKEAEEHIIELHDDCPFTVAHMIYWFYSDRCSPLNLFETSRNPNILRNMTFQGDKFPDSKETHTIYTSYKLWRKQALLYVLADKYEIPVLMSKTQEVLNLCLSTTSKPPLRDLVDCISVVVIKKNPVLLKIVFDTMHRQMKNSRSMFEEITTIFESDTDVIKSAQEYIFAQADMRRDMVEQVAGQIEKAVSLLKIVSDDVLQSAPGIGQRYDGSSLIPLQDRINQIQSDIKRLM